MKKNISTGTVVVIVAVVVLLAGYFIYKAVFALPPAPGDDGKPIPTLSKEDMMKMKQQDVESHPAPPGVSQ